MWATPTGRQLLCTQKQTGCPQQHPTCPTCKHTMLYGCLGALVWAGGVVRCSARYASSVMRRYKAHGECKAGVGWIGGAAVPAAAATHLGSRVCGAQQVQQARHSTCCTQLLRLHRTAGGQGREGG
jgi:hypothetical protein